MTIEDIFTEEELRAAMSVRLTDEILVNAVRSGTQAFYEFGHVVMEPQFSAALRLKPTEAEMAAAICFYRLLGAVRTLNDLRADYQFQTLAGCTRLIFELCVDVGLLFGKEAVEGAVDRFHGFTRAARFRLAYKTVEFYKRHPELEDPGDADERRALVEAPGRQAEIEALCQSLWERHKAPEHWSGLRWGQQVERLGPEIEERFTQWSQLFAWHVHGGGAGVSGLNRRAFYSLEVICRETVKAMLPEAYRLLGVGMHMHRAIPTFFDDLWRVGDQVEVCSVIDARLVSLGRPSKLVQLRAPAARDSTA